MSLNIKKLEKVKYSGSYVSLLDVLHVRKYGHDRKGDHLFIDEQGRFLMCCIFRVRTEEMNIVNVSLLIVGIKDVKRGNHPLSPI